MILSYKAACISRTGRIRDDNEDNFYFGGRVLPAVNDGLKKAVYLEGSTKDILTLAVFDGMGGEVNGEIAACTAAEEFKIQAEALRAKVQQPREFLEAAVEKMNGAVFQAGKSLGAERIGTTAAVLYGTLDQVQVCNVGDSRIYRYHKGRLEVLTTDDTVLNPSLKNQRLTQFIGIDSERYSLTAHIKKGTLCSGDIYLLCTDGLYNMVSEKEIRKILSDHRDDITECAEALTSKAEQNGGEDNCTVILAYFIKDSWLSKVLRHT